jgi:hypothetical protein
MRLLMVVALGAYAVYAAAVLLPLLVGSPDPGVVVGFLLQTVCAVAAAIGVWQSRPWAARALVFLGVSIASTSLYEGLVLGIVAFLPTLVAAVIALITTVIAAAYLKGARAIH